MWCIYLAQVWCEEGMTRGQNRKTTEDVEMKGSGWGVKEKRLHGECLSRVHSCHENGVRKRGGSEWVLPSSLKEKIKKLNESIDSCGCLCYTSFFLSLSPTLSFIQLFKMPNLDAMCRRICDLGEKEQISANVASAYFGAPPVVLYMYTSQ